MNSRSRKRKIKISPWVAVGLAAGILAAIFLIFHRWPGSPDVDRGAKVPPGIWRYGIDVSHNNQGRIVWDSLYVMTDSKRRTVRDPYLAKDIKPVSFVFIKATEGASFKDRDFKNNWKNAGKTDLRRGAYHFFRSSKDGEVQARNFISTVGDLRYKDLPPVLDIETIHFGCSRELLNQRALQWLKAVEKHYGRKPAIYASSSFIKDYLNKEIIKNYPVWVAHYEKDSPAYEGWTWWQFTDRAVVKGVPGEVDLSVMRVD
jgi:lysozyme